MNQEAEVVLTHDSYKHIREKVAELLRDASRGFGSDSNTFNNFCLYLLNSGNLKHKIGEVYPGIQLLLCNPHSFWPPSLPDYDHDKTLKVKIIKLLIGSTLVQAYRQHRYSLINKKEITEYLTQKCQELKDELAGKPVKSLSDSPFKEINPNYELRMSWSNYILLSFLSSFALSIFMGYKSAWYFVEKIVLNKIELDYDKIDNRIEHGAYLTVIFSIFSLLVVTNLLGIFLIDRFLSKHYHDKYFADWQVVNVSEFISMTIQTEIPQQLYKAKSNNTDKIWHDWSHLSVLTANKSPMSLRAYCHYELNLLQSSMDFKDFCKLIMCLLFDSETTISDAPYAVATDFLRQPESWVADTRLSRRQCKSFLQAYIRLAIIDYLLEELDVKDVINRPQVVAILGERKTSILQELEVFNNKTLKYKITAINPMVTGTVIMLLLPIYSGLLFYFKHHHLQGNEAEKLPEHPTEMMNVAHYFIPYIPLLLFALIHRCAVKLIDLVINRENKSTMNMLFFTDKVIRNTPQLQIFEQEDTLAAIC